MVRFNSYQKIKFLEGGTSRVDLKTPDESKGDITAHTHELQ